MSMLALFGELREHLLHAGFERQRAHEVISALFSYAIGYAMVELSTRPFSGTEEVRTELRTDVERVTELVRRLPRETPTSMVEAAYAFINHEAGDQFAFGLNLMLTGLRAIHI